MAVDTLILHSLELIRNIPDPYGAGEGMKENVGKINVWISYYKILSTSFILEKIE